MGGQFPGARDAGQDRDRGHARRAAGNQVMAAVADHRHAGRVQPLSRAEGQQRAGFRLGPVAAIEARDKVEIVQHPGMRQMTPGRFLGIVRYQPDLQPPVAKPREKRDQIGGGYRLCLGGEGVHPRDKGRVIGAVRQVRHQVRRDLGRGVGDDRAVGGEGVGGHVEPHGAAKAIEQARVAARKLTKK